MIQHNILLKTTLMTFALIGFGQVGNSFSSGLSQETEELVATSQSLAKVYLSKTTSPSITDSKLDRDALEASQAFATKKEKFDTVYQPSSKYPGLLLGATEPAQATGEAVDELQKLFIKKFTLENISEMQTKKKSTLKTFADFFNAANNIQKLDRLAALKVPGNDFFYGLQQDQVWGENEPYGLMIKQRIGTKIFSVTLDPEDLLSKSPIASLNITRSGRERLTTLNKQLVEIFGVLLEDASKKVEAWLNMFDPLSSTLKRKIEKLDQKKGKLTKAAKTLHSEITAAGDQTIVPSAKVNKALTTLDITKDPSDTNASLLKKVYQKYTNFVMALDLKLEQTTTSLKILEDLWGNMVRKGRVS